MYENYYELKAEEISLLKCEINDEHVRKKLDELKKIIHELYRVFMRINKSSIAESEKKFALTLDEFRNRYFEIRSLLLKMIDIKKFLNENNNNFELLKV